MRSCGSVTSLACSMAIFAESNMTIDVKCSDLCNTVEHDFYGHEVNGIHGVNGKTCYSRTFHLVNKLHDFTGIHDLSGNFYYNDFFRKTHARLYFVLSGYSFF